MKFYISKFLTMYFWLAVLAECVAIYGLYIGIYKPTQFSDKHTFMCSILLIQAVVSLLLMIRMAYYIVIEEEELIIKNDFSSLFEVSFKYDNIEYIKYTSSTKSNGFTIYRKDGESKYYPLECVRDKDYPKIIKMLQAKGVRFKNHEFWMK